MTIRLMCSRLSLLLLLGPVACTSWRTQRLTPLQVVERHPDRIRVTLTDRSTLVLRHPMISGGAITGENRGTRISIAPGDVAWTEVRAANTWKTVLFVHLLMGVTLVVTGFPGSPMD
jgi:hypothetical protein